MGRDRPDTEVITIPLAERGLQMKRNHKAGRAKLALATILTLAVVGLVGLAGITVIHPR